MAKCQNLIRQKISKHLSKFLCKKMSHSKKRSSTPQGHVQQDASYCVHHLLDQFWPSQMQKIENLPASTFRDQHHAQELPLARIKKIMKLDEDVRNQMISAEAPVLFAKAAEMFVEELTLRAWVHTEDNKRKTLQKNDIAMAIAKYDQFDFLIDIVPREEIKSPPKKPTNETVQFSTVQLNQSGGLIQQPTATILATSGGQQLTTAGGSDQRFFIQTMPNGASAAVGGAGTVVPQAIQLQGGQFLQAQLGQHVQLLSVPNSNEIQIVQQQPQQQQQSAEQLPQVFQQIFASDGSVQHVPLQLSSAQLQFLKAQFGQQQQQSGQQQQQHRSANQQQHATIFLQTSTSSMHDDTLSSSTIDKGSK